MLGWRVFFTQHMRTLNVQESGGIDSDAAGCSVEREGY